MAVNPVRRFFRTIILITTIFFCVVFLLSQLIPYLNPDRWWMIGFLGLTVPYVFFILVFLVFFWLIAKPKFALLPLLTLIIGWKQVRATFAVNLKASADFSHKSDSVIRIVSWNVANMYGLSNDKEIKKHDRTELADAIIELKPDIICLQEFNHSYTQGEEADNIGLFTHNYPYYYYGKDVNKDTGFYTYGSIIFSKLPITDSGRLTYPGRYNGSLIYADVVKQQDTFRVYTTHLQSFAFDNRDYTNMEKIKDRDNDALQASKSIFSKMKLAFTIRGRQSDIARAETNSSHRPSIMCGDFNDVPGSYTYFHMRGSRQDAFLQKGLGIGATFSNIVPTLRIDYILPDNNFTIQQFDMTDENLSDHVMLVSDITLHK